MPSVVKWIVAFKAFKSATLTLLGLILLTTRHSDPTDLLVRAALAVHLPLTSRLLDRALAFSLELTVAKQMALAATAFGYAVLMGAEGVALHLRKSWAPWFTIVATGSLIPIEIYEIVREVHPIRVLILLANIAILIYLFEKREMFRE